MSDVELVERFNAAWLAGDLDAVLGCLAPDVVYCGSGRAAPAEPVVGRDRVAAVFAEQVGDDPDLRLGPVIGVGGRALCEWSYPPGPDGSTLRGVDVYVVRDGRIAAKDVFGKTTIA